MSDFLKDLITYGSLGAILNISNPVCFRSTVLEKHKLKNAIYIIFLNKCFFIILEKSISQVLCSLEKSTSTNIYDCSHQGIILDSHRPAAYIFFGCQRCENKPGCEMCNLQPELFNSKDSEIWLGICILLLVLILLSIFYI